MGRCSVLGCHMNHYQKRPNVTFHRLPKNKKRKELWLDILGIENVNATSKRVLVCSLHFEDKWFNRTLNVTRLRDDALPSKELLAPAQSEDCGEQQEQLSVPPRILEEKPVSSTSNFGDACRICLVMDAKLVSMRTYKLEQAYENVTGISLSEEEKLPQKLCMECVQRLLNCSRFRLKSLKANSLMLEVIEKQDCLTVQNIKTINRLNNQLTSSLSTKHFEVNHYDSYIVDYEEDQPIIIQDEPTTVIVDTKDDGEILLIEEIPDKNDDGLNEPGVNDPGFDDDGITDTDVLNEKDDVSEIEYVLSDKDGYSSDDSIYLEKRETKNATKRKEIDEQPVKTAKRVKTINDQTEPKIDRKRKPFSNDLKEPLFTITNLTFEEQIAELVKRQESSQYKNAVYKCTACFKGFTDEDAYNSHMTRHTNQSGELICEICKMYFKNPRALSRHRKAYHTQRFSCKQCTFMTMNRTSVVLHVRWHKGTKYKCPHCQDEFVRKTTCMSHIRIKHPSDFVCELCGYSFIGVKGLEMHKKLKHCLDHVQIPEDGPLCELCNVRFISSEALKRHLNVSLKHNIGTERESNKAKKRKKTKEVRKRERRQREKTAVTFEEPVPCEQCGVQLEGSRAYHMHFRRMHPDKNRTKYPSMKYPCMCEVCGKLFQSQAHLKDHSWVHSDERTFKCDSCDKAFRMKQNLLIHKQIHSEVRTNHECHICGKHFSSDPNRRRHMLVHTDEKPYKCEICEKAFKSAAEKSSHINYVHLKKPWPKRVRGKRKPATRQVQLASQDQDMDSPTLPPCDPNSN